MKLFLTVTIAMVAFAANSIMNRLALGEGSIDASSFTLIRLLSAALTLAVLTQLSRHQLESPLKTTHGSWFASIALFSYALTFSYAYLYLDTGTGALILFGTVQLTMNLTSFIRGQKILLTEWLGLGIAFLGFVYLVSPQLSTPSLLGFILMTVAGISWACYTLLGKCSTHPLHDTYHNFLRTLPLLALLLVFTFPSFHISPKGLGLSLLSGSLASGIGYAVWYSAVKNLTTTRAAVVQLLVPVFAAIGGILFMQEAITPRLAIASLFILGGILIVSLSKEKRS